MPSLAQYASVAPFSLAIAEISQAVGKKVVPAHQAFSEAEILDVLSEL